MAVYVIDASVLVELFVAGPESDACIRFLEQTASDLDELHAPDMIYYEVAGALRKYELKDAGYTQFGEDVANLFDLDIVITLAKDLLLPAVEIARAHMLSVYDSFYLALAQQLGATLVTVDQRLVNGAANKPFQVKHVAEVGQ